MVKGKYLIEKKDFPEEIIFENYLNKKKKMWDQLEVNPESINFEYCVKY